MRIEKPDSLVAIHADRPLDDAVETATIHLMDWLITEYGFSPTDAYCLVSTCPDFRINVYQMCRIRNLRPVAGAEIPKNYLLSRHAMTSEGGSTIMPVLATPGLGRSPGPPRRWLFGNLREFSRDQLGTHDRVGLANTATSSRPGSVLGRSSSSTIPTWSRRSWSTRIASSSSTTGCGRPSGRWATDC